MEPGTSLYRCPECDHEPFSRPYHLEAHLNSAHRGGLKPFKCDNCDMSYTRRNDLNEHCRVKHSFRRYICHVFQSNGFAHGCGQAFTRKTSLQRHLGSSAGQSCRTEGSFESSRQVNNQATVSIQPYGAGNSDISDFITFQDFRSTTTALVHHEAQYRRWQPSAHLSLTLAGQRLLSPNSNIDLLFAATKIASIAAWPLFPSLNFGLFESIVQHRLKEIIYGQLLCASRGLIKEYQNPTGTSLGCRSTHAATPEDFGIIAACIGLMAMYASWLGNEQESLIRLSLFGSRPFLEESGQTIAEVGAYTTIEVSRNEPLPPFVDVRAVSPIPHPPRSWKHYVAENTLEGGRSARCISIGTVSPSPLAELLGTGEINRSSWISTTIVPSESKQLSPSDILLLSSKVGESGNVDQLYESIKQWDQLHQTYLDSAASDVVVCNHAAKFALSPSQDIPYEPSTTDLDWKRYKPVIAEQYVRGRKTAEDLMTFMELNYGFRASKAMYKNKIRDWCLRKYSLGPLRRFRKRRKNFAAMMSNSTDPTL